MPPGRSGFPEAEPLEYPVHRAEIGDAALEQVQAHEHREPQPGRMRQIRLPALMRERQGQENEETSDDTHSAVDGHDIFQRQWLKRKVFYKKNNYKIIGISNKSYHIDTKKWKSIFKPKNPLINSNSETENEKDEIKENGHSDGLTGKCFLKIPTKK